MSTGIERPSRRAFVRRATYAAVAFTAADFFAIPGLFAEQLTLTPRQTEGPFYPDRLPLDTNNDLIIIGNNVTPAIGVVTHLSGRILTAAGSPIRNAIVEIWQVDGNGVYLHSSQSAAARDKNFQGFGRFETGAAREYRFRTGKPVPYPGPTPPVHFPIQV